MGKHPRSADEFRPVLDEIRQANKDNLGYTPHVRYSLRMLFFAVYLLALIFALVRLALDWGQVLRP